MNCNVDGNESTGKARAKPFFRQVATAQNQIHNVINDPSNILVSGFSLKVDQIPLLVYALVRMVQNNRRI
jgi:hypothetical protein